MFKDLLLVSWRIRICRMCSFYIWFWNHFMELHRMRKTNYLHVLFTKQFSTEIQILGNFEVKSELELEFRGSREVNSIERYLWNTRLGWAFPTPWSECQKCTFITFSTSRGPYHTGRTMVRNGHVFVPIWIIPNSVTITHCYGWMN